MEGFSVCQDLWACLFKEHQKYLYHKALSRRIKKLSPFQETGYLIRETGYPIRETGYPIWETGYPIWETGYLLRVTRYPDGKPGTPFGKPGTHFGRPAMTVFFFNFWRFWAGIQISRTIWCESFKMSPSFDIRRKIKKIQNHFSQKRRRKVGGRKREIERQRERESEREREREWESGEKRSFLSLSRSSSPSLLSSICLVVKWRWPVKQRGPSEPVAVRGGCYIGVPPNLWFPAR